jgi:hypothetical protein
MPQRGRSWTGYLVLSTQYAHYAGSVAILLLSAHATAEAAAPEFAARLEALAAKCDELKLPEQASITRAWRIERYPSRQYLFLPGAADVPPPDGKSPDFVKKWYAKFRELRIEQAANLFTEAEQALADDRPARAYQLLFEALREDPDHAEARRILGYNRKGNGPWLLPETERMRAEVGRVPHARLGWAAGKYWRLETPHFQIVTNHSAKEALEAGNLLEDLHALWRQMFFRYWSNRAALEARFAGGREPLAPARPRMQVVLFKSRDEYLAKLAPAQPQIGLTMGIYLDQERTSYFYAGDTSIYPTWQHEATHQLFQEAVPGTIDHPGEEQNFWAIEGVALYMESLKRGHSTFSKGCWTAGGCEADRLQFARYRALAGDFYQPLASLVTLGREELQTSADIRKLYAQSAGISQFLMIADIPTRSISESGTLTRSVSEGTAESASSGTPAYREAFTDLLTAIYRGDDTSESLAKLTGAPYPALDEQYRTFLNVTDDDLAGIPDPLAVKNLSLGRTSVTDAGLAHLAGCKNLQWLDLSLTAITDGGLQPIAGAVELKQLFLEGTQVTDASLPLIAKFKQLEDLDLSKLALTNEGLAALAGLKQLKILYLTGTPITDAGLAHLRGLKQLEQLETTGTRVTPEGLRRLQAALPKLTDSARN